MAILENGIQSSSKDHRGSLESAGIEGGARKPEVRVGILSATRPILPERMLGDYCDFARPLISFVVRSRYTSRLLVWWSGSSLMSERA